MNGERTCAKCGATLPSDAPEGLCPQCLIKGALRARQSATASATEIENQKSEIANPAGPPTPAELAPHFPQLEILELIGQGGMGIVYKARQPHLDRFVALKILGPDIRQDPAFAERFAREARALARLNHPGIVTVHDFGQAGSHFYFLMEFVDGMNLRQLEQTRRLTPQEALSIVPKICEALQYAHDEGIVHRDIKPGNILFDKKGRVKIADFGLAKLVGAAAAEPTLTDTGKVMGTPRYMAPEQFDQPQAVDHRADIYSLGVVFYEMLTGEVPMGRFAPPSQKVRVDVRLDEVVLKSLEKEPERRYQHASEVKTDVEAVSISHAVPARGIDIPGPKRQAVCAQLLGPSTALLVAGGVNFVPLALYVVLVSVRLSEGGMMGFIELALLLVAMLDVASGIFVMVGAIKMRRCQSHRFAVVTSVIAMLPIGPGFVVGLTAGIWSLLALSKGEVKAAFSGRGCPPENYEPPPPGPPPWGQKISEAKTDEETVTSVLPGPPPLLREIYRETKKPVRLRIQVAGWTVLSALFYCWLWLPASIGPYEPKPYLAYLDTHFWPYRGRSKHTVTLLPQSNAYTRLDLTEERELRFKGARPDFSGDEPLTPDDKAMRFEITAKIDIQARQSSTLKIDVLQNLQWSYTDRTGNSVQRPLEPFDTQLVLEWMSQAGLDTQQNSVRREAETLAAVIKTSIGEQFISTVAGPTDLPVGRLERIVRNSELLGSLPAAKYSPFRQHFGTAWHKLEPLISINWVGIPLSLVLWTGGLWMLGRRRTQEKIAPLEPGPSEGERGHRDAGETKSDRAGIAAGENAALASSSTPDARPSTLRRAWMDWWAGRNRVFTNVVKAALVVVYFFAVFAFVTFKTNPADQVAPGSRRLRAQVGWPAPWFVAEKNFARLSGGSSVRLQLSSAWLMAGLAALALYVFGLIRKAEGTFLRWEYECLRWLPVAMALMGVIAATLPLFWK